jgi:uncharacterized membrane protein
MFPLLTLDQLRAAAPEQQQTLYAEIRREAATIVMLAAIALAVSGNGRQWAAAFGVYATWVGPVIAPILVSLAMIVSYRGSSTRT